MKKFTKTIILTAVAILASCMNSSAQTKYKDIFDMIRGKVPGVQVGQAGAGQMPSIIIRGIGTNTEHTQPLFVVDGVITDNIAYILPEDVDSIDIIKDGTASIYGAQGANGVIMVTTKSYIRAQEVIAQQKKAARQAKKESRKKK